MGTDSHPGGRACPRGTCACSTHVHANVVFLYFCQLTIREVILGSASVGTATIFPVRNVFTTSKPVKFVITFCNYFRE